MDSCLTHLEGSRSHARYDADVLHTLDPIDDGPLLARYDLGRASRTLTRFALADRGFGGMWRWSELLPVRDPDHILHLGEGDTPLLPANRLGGALGLDRLLVKAEGQNPTGSFKARGMAAAVSRAVELGATSLIVPSAGNAGGALAAYGAAAGVPVTVVLPVDSAPVNITEAQIAGAEVILVDGVISDCGTVARAIAARTGAFDMSTLKEPYRIEGKKTMGLELCEQLGWAVPDVVVYPTGGGTGLIGMWKAFEELEELGFIGSGRPRMVVAQAAGCAPMVRAFENGDETATPWEDPQTRASGLRVPGAVGDRLILQAVRESGGTAVAVTEADIGRLQRLAARRGAGYVSPESATAFAAAATLADERWITARERVVVFDCGVGLKYPPPPLEAPPIVSADVIADPEKLDAIVDALLGGLSSAEEVDRVERLVRRRARRPETLLIGSDEAEPARGVAPREGDVDDPGERPHSGLSSDAGSQTEPEEPRAEPRDRPNTQTPADMGPAGAATTAPVTKPNLTQAPTPAPTPPPARTPAPTRPPAAALDEAEGEEATVPDDIAVLGEAPPTDGQPYFLLDDRDDLNAPDDQATDPEDQATTPEVQASDAAPVAEVATAAQQAPQTMPVVPPVPAVPPTEPSASIVDVSLTPSTAKFADASPTAGDQADGDEAVGDYDQAGEGVDQVSAQVDSGADLAWSGLGPPAQPTNGAGPAANWPQPVTADTFVTAPVTDTTIEGRDTTALEPQPAPADSNVAVSTAVASAPVAPEIPAPRAESTTASSTPAPPAGQAVDRAILDIAADPVDLIMPGPPFREITVGEMPVPPR